MSDNNAEGLAGLKKRIEVIEQSYEFMLAYAAQGSQGDPESKSAGQLRDALSKAEKALSGLADEFVAHVERSGLEPKASYAQYLQTVRRDAESSHAAIQITRRLERISSQLIDNLNASIHIRALLTDLFFIDEVLKAAERDGQKSTA